MNRKLVRLSKYWGIKFAAEPSTEQLNLFVKPKLGVLYPIPITIVPTLRKLSLHEESEGYSNMARALRDIENNKNINNYTTILAIQDKKILGWALITQRENNADIDLYTDKSYRRSNVANMLRNKALLIINEKGLRYSGREHFDPLKYNEERKKLLELSKEDRDKELSRETRLYRGEMDKETIKYYLRDIEEYKKEIDHLTLKINNNPSNAEYYKNEIKEIEEEIHRVRRLLLALGFDLNQLEFKF